MSGRAKVPEDAKKAAIEAAISGGDPFEFLQPYSENPKKLWAYMKQQLKESDPETYAKIPDLRNRKKEKPVEVNMAPEPAEEPAEMDDLETTAVRDKNLGEFYFDHDHNCIDWRNGLGDEISLGISGWKIMIEKLPKILKKLGVVL